MKNTKNIINNQVLFHTFIQKDKRTKRKGDGMKQIGKINKRMVKAIFFDFDGVLTTDKTGSFTSSRYFTKKLNVDFQELFEAKQGLEGNIDSGKMTNSDVCKAVCEKLGKRFEPQWVLESFLATPIDFKMVDYARKLKSEFLIGMITDNSVERVNVLLEKHNLANLFDPIIISAAVKCTKKGTEIFDIAAKQIGLKPGECAFIDNSEKNIVSAQQAGFIGVYFSDEIRDYQKLFDEIDSLKKEI